MEDYKELRENKGFDSKIKIALYEYIVLLMRVV